MKFKLKKIYLQFNYLFFVNLFINFNLLFLINYLRDPIIISNQSFLNNIVNIFNVYNFISLNLITSFIILSLVFIINFLHIKIFEEKIFLLFFLSITITVFYFIGINTLSRIILLLFLLTNYIEIFLAKKTLYILCLLKSLIILVIYFQPVNFEILKKLDFQNQIEYQGNNFLGNEVSNEIISNFENKTQQEIYENLNSKNFLSMEYEDATKCINTFSSDMKKVEKEYYIVGHAYGSGEGNNQGLSNKLLEYFDGNYKNIILTGDLVRENNATNLNIVKSELFSKFDNYFIAVGNHDLSKEYYQIFSQDLFLIKEKSVDLVVANFSTANWKPDLADQTKINEFINKSKNKTVIIFSHQLFWFHLVDNPVLPNGFHLLRDKPDSSNFNWIDIKNKNLIIISGDYGQNNINFFCEYQSKNKVVFVANGISDENKDSIIKLNLGNEGFNFEILPLTK